MKQKGSVRNRVSSRRYRNVSAVMPEHFMHKPKNNSVRKIILVVEDNPELRQFYQYALEDFYDVVIVPSGEAALDKLKVLSRIDLMVLDLKLPGMSGIDVLDEMEKNFPSVPVLIVSANRQGEGIAGQLLPGTYEFVEKPFTVENLMDKIKSRIGQVRSG